MSTLLLKSVFALLEIAAGLGLWLVPHPRIEDLTGWLVQSHLIEGYTSPVYARVAEAMGQFSLASQHFYALYPGAHGIIKLTIVLLLMRQVAFVYPLGIVAFSGFITTQMHRWNQTHSPVLLGLSALDLVVIALTWRAWRSQHR